MRFQRIHLISVVLAIISIGMSGCFYDHHHHDHDNSIVGSGRIRSEQRTVPPCSGVRIEGSAKVYLRQDAVQSIEVEADDNILDRVVTRSENGILVVGLEDGSYTETTVNIFVSLPGIESVEIEGAGDIVGRNPLQSDAIRCYIGGAGNISLTGVAATQTVIIDGAGNVNNFDLATTRTSVTINGTGECDVDASQRFDGVINGVGSIFYDGNPAEVHKAVNGVGRISPR